MSSKKRPSGSGGHSKSSGKRQKKEEEEYFQIPGFNEKQMALIKKAQENANDDPLLILDWNPEWDDPDGTAPVIEALLNHGGQDPQDSRFIFHFNTYAELIQCRDALREITPQAFHLPPGAVATMNEMMAEDATPIEPEQPIASAWIVQKIQTLSSDCAEDRAFFARV